MVGPAQSQPKLGPDTTLLSKTPLRRRRRRREEEEEV
jgi:hypothetical protein